jgi:SAM-dependent methyltransferase
MPKEKQKKGVVFYNNMFAQDTYEIHRYDVGSYCTRQEIIKSIRHTSGTVLEIGTGISTLLEDLPTFDRFGIDIAPDSIKRAQQICKERHINANLQVADATKLPFPNAFFDVIVSSHVLEHIKDDAAVLQECARVLKPGGELIIWVPGRVSGVATQAEWEKNGHYRMYNRKRFDDLHATVQHSLVLASLVYPHKMHNFVWNRAKHLVRWINYPIKKWILRDNKTYEIRPVYQKVFLPAIMTILNACDRITRKTEKKFLSAEFNVLARFESAASAFSGACSGVSELKNINFPTLRDSPMLASGSLKNSKKERKKVS